MPPEHDRFFETRHKQFREVREAAYREVREQCRERWREHFREADAIRQEVQRKGADLATEIMQLARNDDFASAWQMYPQRDTLLVAAEKQIAEARNALRDEQCATTRHRQDAACKELYDERALAFAQIKQRQKEERGELKHLQAAREDQHPYDRERLINLVRDRPSGSARDTERRTEPENVPRTNDADRRADHEFVAQAARDSPEVREQLEPKPAGPEHVAADHVRDGSREKPRRDLADGIAGGIAKAAELVGKVIESFISPETPQEKAGREALARVLAETVPEHEAAEIQRELDNRQAAYEKQKSAEEKFDQYFARHGDRLRREEEERRRKDKDRDR